jgi:sialic acid synthase SpsE
MLKIVAEITNNHLGDLKRLLKMTLLAKQAGADYVKIQKRDVLSFYTKDQLNEPYASPFGTTKREYRLGVELSEWDIDVFDQYCNMIGIDWFCSVLDIPSYEIIKKYGKMIKIPSTVSNYRGLYEHIAKDSPEVVISTGMTDQGFTDYVLDLFGDPYLLHCVSSYPAPPEDLNLSVIKNYHKSGYSSHDEGWLGSVMAVAAGAKMIEKHVKLGSTDWVHFDHVALDLETEFPDYVKMLRQAEVMMGDGNKRIMDSEFHKYTN